MSFIETEVIPSLSRAINFVLETFKKESDRDLEGLSVRTLLLNKLVEKKLCNMDIRYHKRMSIEKLGDRIKWMNHYFEQIDGDMKELLKHYAAILNNKVTPKMQTFPEFNQLLTRTAARATYKHLDYDRIFANCNNCPASFLCFCQLKTFLTCVFSGEVYTNEKSLLNGFFKHGKIVEHHSLRKMVRDWLKENFFDASSPEDKSFKAGYPYLIRSVVEKFSERINISSLRERGDWKDDGDPKYREIDPYVTLSLLTLLLDKTFAEYFELPEEIAVTRASKAYRNIIETIKAMQNQAEADRAKPKTFLFESGGFSYEEYPIYGSWDEGFWGGQRVVRVKSTADIARMLYKLEENSPETKEAIERAIEFVVKAFASTVTSDRESRNYIVDDCSFRHTHTSTVSNISGTIAALRFLLAIKELRKETLRDLSLPKDVANELSSPEEFFSRKLKWLIKQQRGDGGFPILSQKFAGSYFSEVYPPEWIKEMIDDEQTFEIRNVSLNATIEAILLFLEYIERQSSESFVVLRAFGSEMESFNKLSIERRSMIRNTLHKLDKYHSLIMPRVSKSQAERLEDAEKHLAQGLLHNRPAELESAVTLISKVFERFLFELLKGRSEDKWGPMWKTESERELGLSKQIGALSYYQTMDALSKWNKNFPHELIVPPDYIRRIDFFRIVRILCVHEKDLEEYTNEVVAFQKAWEEDHNRFEADLIFAIENALYIIERLTDRSRGIPTTAERFSPIIERLLLDTLYIVRAHDKLAKTEFRKIKDSLNQANQKIKTISKELPQKFVQVFGAGRRPILNLLSDAVSTLPEDEPRMESIRRHIKSAHEDKDWLADPSNMLSVLSSLLQIASVPAALESSLSRRIIETIKRLIGEFGE